MRHIIYGHLCCTYNSEIEAILQSDSMQINDRKWSTPGHIRQIIESFFFSNKNVCFWIGLVSGFQKNNFHFCATYRNAQNRILENDVNVYGFWAIVCKNRYINLKFGIADVQA